MKFSEILKKVEESKNIKSFKTIETNEGLVLEIEEKDGVFHSYLKNIVENARYLGRYNVLTGKTINTFTSEYNLKQSL